MVVEKEVERITGIVKEISKTDKAVCVIPKENPKPLCSFTKNGEAEIAISMGKNDGRNTFNHFEGINADVAKRYDNDKVLRKINLVNSSSYKEGGSCFTKGRVRGKIPAGKCIVETSGQFETVSRDTQRISIRNDLREKEMGKELKKAIGKVRG